MTTVTSAVVFEDAERMHVAALDRMAAGDIRDAAEKAWCAAKRATDALVLARTGQLPPKSPDTTKTLQSMAAADPSYRGLRASYFARQVSLHGNCFYTGWCEPIEDIELLIRETADFIRDARRLAET